MAAVRDLAAGGDDGPGLGRVEAADLQAGLGAGRLDQGVSLDEFGEEASSRNGKILHRPQRVYAVKGALGELSRSQGIAFLSHEPAPQVATQCIREGPDHPAAPRTLRRLW